MWPFILTMIAVLLVVGTTVAMWWWKVSAKIKPYRDEVERDQRRAAAGQPDEVVVIKTERGGSSDGR